MNHSNTPFCSLSQLLLTSRDKNVVAFQGDEHIGWSQFVQNVSDYTHLLNRYPQPTVALCARDSYWFAVGFFALCHSGKSIVLPGNYQPQALAELSAHFDLLLHDSELNDIANCPNIELGKVTEPSPHFDFAPLALDATKLTLFTSGSSGVPKAIHKTLRQLDVEVSILQSLWGEALSGCRIEATVSHQHIYGLLFRLLWPLCAGRPFARHNLEFPEQVSAHASPDVALISSPALLKRLSEEHQANTLRMTFSSGGPLPHSAAVHAHELFGSLPVEVFGSTETGGIAHRQQAHAVTPWQLFPRVEATLNQENCLRLRSAHVDPQGWYQTADECEFVDARHFVLKGRTDRIIKVEEKRVSLVEVEKRAEQLSYIDECAVIPASEGERTVLLAAIVLTQDGHQSVATLGKGKFWLLLRNELRQWLEPIAVPRRFRIVTEIPLNSQGKRQNTEIERLFADAQTRD